MYPEANYECKPEPELDPKPDKYCSLAQYREIAHTHELAYMHTLNNSLQPKPYFKENKANCSHCSQAYPILKSSIQAQNSRIYCGLYFFLIQRTILYKHTLSYIRYMIRAHCFLQISLYYCVQSYILTGVHTKALFSTIAANTHSYASSTLNSVWTSQYSVSCIQIFDIQPLPPSKSRSTSWQVAPNSSKTRSTFVDQHLTSPISASRAQI